MYYQVPISPQDATRAPAHGNCFICFEVLPRIAGKYPHLRLPPTCNHLIIQNQTYRCPPHSHIFGGQPNIDCVAKIVYKDRFHDSVVKRIEHPNVVKHVQTIPLIDPATEAVVTRVCKGGNLSQRIEVQSRPCTEDQIVCLLVQLLLAVNHLHCLCNTMHRDISTNNIFLVAVLPDGTSLIELGDFGLAKTMHEASVGDAVFTSSVGTTPYMAPEVKYAEPLYNNLADIFSVGAIMYEFIVGIRAFPCTLRPQDCKLTYEKKMLLQDACPSLAIFNLIESMLEFEFSERPSTVGVFTQHRFMAEGLQKYWSDFCDSYAAQLAPDNSAARETLLRQVQVLTSDPRQPPSEHAGRMRRITVYGEARGGKEWCDLYVHPRLGVWAIRLRRKFNAMFIDVQDIDNVSFAEDTDLTVSLTDERKQYEPLTDDDDESLENTTDDGGYMVIVQSRCRARPYMFCTDNESTARRVYCAIRGCFDANRVKRSPPQTLTPR